MINIVYLIGNLGAGGAEKLVCDLAIGLEKSKFKVSIIAIGHYKDEQFERNRIDLLRQNGVDVKIVSKKPHGNRLSTIRKLRGVFKADRPDIIHSHLFTGIFYGAVASIGIKTHMVITYHSTSGFGVKDKVISRIFSRKYDRIIAVSESVKIFVHNFFKIPDQKIVTIYNGTDTKRFFDSKIEYEETSNDRTDITFGCVGRISEAKGYKYLVEALAKLEKKILQNITVKIAGDGPLREEMEEMVKKNNLEDHVEFVGNLTDIPKFLCNVDVYIMPSLWEGFGISLIEAMAAGKPLIVSDIPVFKEILGVEKLNMLTGFSDTIFGTIFEVGNSQALANAIERMIENREKWPKFGKNSYERAKSFDISKTVEQHEKLYMNIVQKDKK